MRAKLFIEEIMYEILKEVSEDYFQKKKIAQDMSAEELYKKILDTMDMDIVEDDGKEGTIIFPTPGCPHNVKDGHHCGCSFCDWNDTYVAHPAYVFELRKKDANLYRNMQLEYLRRLRESNHSVHIFEEYAIHDCFDEKELSEEERNYLFEEKHAIGEMPIIALAQVRAESITKEKLQKWKGMAKRQLTLGIGVETGEQWIRNHWLNKKMDDDTIRRAVTVAHENKCKVSANILMMLPGLTLKQNVELLKESVKKLDTFGIDSFMLSPLVVKKYTIQKNIKSSNLENENCISGMLLIFKEIGSLDKKYQEKLMFSSINFKDYFAQFKLSEQQIEQVDKMLELLTAGGMKSAQIEKIADMFQVNCNKEFYEQYQAMDGMDKIKTTLQNAAFELVTNVLEESRQKEVLTIFQKELNNWDERKDAKI
ncbi:MAG TPA: hypothetical protein DCW90_15765 [Lachnospiraceae bacterium]|nr:hypothetical protein [uncultured Lachnoclostridium sp.]HAU86887.1 hypothetical protein [Lachnospiraceae bacterium]